jgi:hypothetical protein
VHVEGLAGHPGRDHVRIVSAADGRESVGALDACLDENLAVEAGAGDLAALEAGPKLAEGLRILVNDGNRVPLVLQNVGDSGSNPPASHDHDVHGLPFSENDVLINDARSRYAPPARCG